MPLVEFNGKAINVSQKFIDRYNEMYPTYPCPRCNTPMEYGTEMCGHNDYNDTNTCKKCRLVFSGYGVDALKRDVDSWR